MKWTGAPVKPAYDAYDSVNRKNRILWVGAPVLTLLALVLGLCLPRITAAVLDRQLAGTTERLENGAVSLTLAQELELVELPSLDFFQTLALVSEPFTSVALSEGGQRMAAEEAGIAAMYPVHFIGADVLELGTAPDQVTPMLLTSEADPSLSAVLWRCGWRDQPEDLVWVDDQSGTAVSFRLALAHRAAPLKALTELLSMFCEDQYPSDIASVEFAAWDSPYAIHGVILLERLRDQSSEGPYELALACDLQDSTLFFNWLWPVVDISFVPTEADSGNTSILIPEETERPADVVWMP